MADVQWIKLNVGMFDGYSFKRIKKAKIGGERFRDKLTAVWFELLDLAGKCNACGQLIESAEIPFASLDDIAVIIDREPEELKLCMQYYINERMVTVIDDVYMLTNWAKFQNEDGLEKIREQTRKRVAKHRENQKLLLGNVTCNVTVTQCNETDIEEDKDKDIDKDKEKEKKKIDYQQIADMYNDTCVSFPKLKTLSDSRKKAIKARLNTYSIDDFKTLFTMAESSDFLKGKNDRNWTANFDWLIKDANMAKVLEGNYSNKAANQKPQPKKNSFNNFNQRTYDYEAMERMLANQNKPKQNAMDDP